MSKISRGEREGVGGTPFLSPSHRGVALSFVFAALTFLLSINLLTAGPGAEAAVNLMVPASTTLTAIVSGPTTEGGTTTIDIVADAFPDGLSGFEISVTLANGAVADITNVSYNALLSPTIPPVVPADSVDLFAADVDLSIGPGATAVTLATLTVQGTAKGSTSVVITVGATLGVQDELGVTITPVDTVSGTLTVVNSAPVVDAGPDQTSINEGTLVSLAPATFTDADSGDTHTATIDWDDGSPLDNIGSVTGTVPGSHTYADDGVYTVTVTVDDGTTTGSDTLIITVDNVVPDVNAGPDQPSVLEGDTVNLAPATFTDVGTADTHTFTINWGDGNVDGPTAAVGGNVPGSHAYADNGSFTVTVTVTDDNAGIGSDTFIVTVANVAPVVSAGANQIVTEGDTVNLDPATFTDAGSGDTHTATIDWGDLTPLDSVGAVTGTVPGFHVYTDNGVFTVTVSVEDDDTAFDSHTLTVTVNNANPVVTPPANIIINVGVNKTVDVNFTDAGSADTHTANIDWGDGTANDVVNPATSPISIMHSFATATTSTPYTVTVTVTDDDGGSGIQTFTVTVQDFPTLPGAFGPAKDLNGDGKAEDVNGNGRIDFADVVLLFQNMLDPSVQDNQLDFDFNGNGRIDFDDVVQLFLSFAP